MTKVTTIIPVKNEEKYISKVLDSLIAQDYPKKNTEILIIDAMSIDNTKKIVEEYRQNFGFIRLLNNPNIFTSFAFNTGIKNSTGDIIIFMGAHTTYSPNYVSTIVKCLNEKKAECVGSVACTLPRKNTTMAKAIVLGLTSPFGVGNSYMRIGSKKVRYADTASCPGYKKEVFEKIGLFNEKLSYSQDMEFNLRLKKAGGRILVNPDIVSYYHARSDFKSFCKHNFRNGVWAILPFKYTTIMPVLWRHLAPLTFVSSIIIFGVLSIFFQVFFWPFLLIIGLYFLCSVYFSTKITIKEIDLRYLFVMPIIFGSLHIGYGLGSLLGMLKVIVSKEFWKNRFSKYALS